jgi:hypothetical protein
VIAIRRIYVYLLAFFGLLMLAGGASNLGRVVLEVLLAAPRTAAGDYVREEVSRAGAAALIGLPVWLIHWWWAQRLAMRAADERASVLRRLYLYVVLAIALVAMAAGVHEALDEALDGRWRDAVTALPNALVGVVVWFGHWRVAAADRTAVGEDGASATLRRWYVYGAGVVGLLWMLSGAHGVLEAIWTALAGSTSAGLTDSVPDAVVGLGIWLVHGVLLTTRFAEADRRATLRSVAVFLSLAAIIGLTVWNLSQGLYYALARLFGVDRPGGVGGSIWLAAAGPVSGVLVYSAAWFVAARGARAIETEAPRQIGTRRLYTYLVTLVALVALAVGIAGLLWVVGDALTGAPGTATGDWWRDKVALFVTLTIVGLPLWVVHWKPPESVDADEARSLSRRLYLYLVLIAASLTLLFSVAAVAYRLLTILLGAPANASLASELAHNLADAIVAGLLVAYHVYAVRRDMRTAPATPPGSISEVLVRVRAHDGADLGSALDELRTRGYEVELVRETPPPERTSPPAV